MKPQTIGFDEGWDYIQKRIKKLERILEGLPEPQFTTEEYMNLYTKIVSMCTQKPPFDYSQQLYDKYRETFEEYIVSTVLPSLREKHDEELMLRELVKRWKNHKVMVKKLSRYFHYLDRYFTGGRALPSLNKVGLICFRDLVYKEVHVKVKDAVIALIEKEREGDEIDRALLKDLLDIFVEIGMGLMDRYVADFEDNMLQETGAYYSRKASSWIEEDSCSEYMLKSEECLKKEKDRVSHYLHWHSEEKLLEKVQHELLVTHENRLLEKEDSGFRAMLRDDKVEDLCRMHRLYREIPRGLTPVANMFKQHVTDEGTALVQQAEEDDASPCVKEHVLMTKISKLHDKYMSYVTDCFQNHTRFHKALEEAFEIFCKKTVTGSSSSAAEVLATFYDNMFNKSGIENQMMKLLKLESKN